MKNKFSVPLWAVSLLALLSMPAQMMAQHQYKVTDLGPVGGPPGQPFVISGSGLISGAASASNGAMHAALWYNALKLDIGKQGLGGANSVAFGINDWGHAVGEADGAVADPNGEDFCGFGAAGLPAGATCLPFIWKGGKMTALPTLRDGHGSGVNGVANQINDRDEIAGVSETATPDPNCVAPQIFQFKPVLWKDGKVHELPTVGGDPDGVALAINQNGQAVGASGTCTSFNLFSTLTNLLGVHAILWENGKATDLGNLGGTNPPAPGNGAVGINNQGKVVGSSFLADNSTFHAFLWTKKNGMEDLGTLEGDMFSAGLNINDGGEIVGVSLDVNFNSRAFLRSNGKMFDLNTLVSADTSLFLLDACFVNANGQIVGLGVDKKTGEAHGFLATPR